MTPYIKMQDFLTEAIVNKIPFTYCSNVDGKMQPIMVFNPTMRLDYE
jgi:hypothetical protein